MDFEFGKAQTIDSLDKVPEPFRGLYQQGESGYVLNESFAPIGSAIDGLNRSLKAARRDADNAMRNRPDVTAYAAVGQLLGLEGEAAYAPDALRDAVEASIQASKDGKVNWDKMKDSLERGFNQKLEAKDKEIEAKDKSLARYLVNSEATRAIASMKGVPELLLPQITAQTKVVNDNGDYVVRVIDAAGDPRGNASGGFMTVEDLVKELKASPTFGRAFESEAPSGNGMKPGSGSQRPAPPRQGELSPVDKIKAGLQQQRR